MDLENLCHCIDFGHISLLLDTVTEILLSHEHDITTTRRLPVKADPDTDNTYALVAGCLRFYIRGDTSRVRFPPCDSDSGTPTTDLSEIRKDRELTSGVHEVHIYGDEQSYVYKVDRPLYESSDTEVLEQELRNLELLRSTKAVMRLIATVVSVNPYKTVEIGPSDRARVLRGLLLEYHPHGTLRDALRFPEPETGRPWQRWALQIARGLDHLHRHGLTHMDLKPSNIVISADFDAVLIDISGRGITQNWLSPEMRDVFCPWSQDLQSRIQNDIWAFGRILSQMANFSCKDVEKQLLKTVALHSTAEIPLRISPHDAISKFEF